MRSCYYLLLFGIIALSSCKSSQLKSDQYLPKYLKSIQLGLVKKEFLTKRPSAVQVHSLQETPRLIFSEEKPWSMLTTAYYFFEKEAPHKLVEFHFIFEEKDAAIQWVEQYFGPKRNKQNQWHKQLRDDRMIHATLRKNKLFIYAPSTVNLY